MGHEDLQLRPPRGAQLPGRECAVLARASITSTACAWMRSPRCCISTTRASTASGLPNQLRRPRESRSDRFPEAAQLDGRPLLSRRADDGRGIDLVPRRDAAGAPRRPRLPLQMEHGLDERHAALHGARSAASPPSPQPDHVLVRVRVLGAFHPAAVARRSRARQALAARQDAGRRMAEAARTIGCCSAT